LKQRLRQEKSALPARAVMHDHRKFVFYMLVLMLAVSASGCSHDRPPTPVATTKIGGDPAVPREAVVETPKQLETATAFRAKLGHGAELFIPPWFTPRRGGYDLIIHFHGLSKLQEANIERAQLNVAVVSVNLGAGTDPYSSAFQKPESFERLLADAEVEIDRSGRARGAKLRRMALSAWSAGFVSIAKVMNEPEVAQRVDAVLLADGFFTNFTNPTKRTVNRDGIEKFAKLVGLAQKSEKLFAITHTAIPTGPYPSVQECVATLLDMSSVTKSPASGTGPRTGMKETYAVDQGSFHVKGYDGVAAGDHVNQIRAMGETLYPYLKARWDTAPPGEDAKREDAKGQGQPKASP